MENTVKLELTKEWDKTFPKSEKVNQRKVTFPNRYGITLAADLYEPKGAEGKLAAIAVCGPFGAVKEQASGLYAQTMAERGFVTMAFDPSFTGESGGTPRYMASPDINTEDFQAAVDFLSVQENVDPERIGIIGICGWGGIALNAAAVLIMHGEKAHSCYFSRDAYDAMVKDNPYTDNKELLIIPDAVHTDLYDGGRKDAIPFDKLEQFFRKM